MGLTLGHGAWQIDQPSNGSMWNSYSFQPVGQWMGYLFTDLGAEGCCRSLNALLTMFLSSYHPEIFRSYYHWQTHVHAKGQGQRSKVKVTKVMTPFSCFWTVTPVWIHIYGDEMMHKAWCCLEEVPYCSSRSSVNFQGHMAKKSSILPPKMGKPE